MAAPIRPGYNGPDKPTSWKGSALAGARELELEAETRRLLQYAKPYDPSPENIRKTAEAARDTKELLEALVQHAIEADERERTMLRWSRVGVFLAGIAAVAAVVAVIVTIAVAS